MYSSFNCGTYTLHHDWVQNILTAGSYVRFEHHNIWNNFLSMPKFSISNHYTWLSAHLLSCYLSRLCVRSFSGYHGNRNHSNGTNKPYNEFTWFAFNHRLIHKAWGSDNCVAKKKTIEQIGWTRTFWIPTRDVENKIIARFIERNNINPTSPF